jgi:hypothetical protein
MLNTDNKSERKSMDAAMFESLDPGLLGALMLVGVPVAAIVVIGLASQFPINPRRSTTDAPSGTPVIERR